MSDEKDRQCGWEDVRKRHLIAGLDATPAQRLAWLEEMIALAHRSGALPRRQDGHITLKSGGSPMGTIARVVRIAPLEDIDEDKELADYRTGCLALSPKERIDEMRRLSRRVISLNPNHPRSPRIARKIVTIVHDAV